MTRKKRKRLIRKLFIKEFYYENEKIWPGYTIFMKDDKLPRRLKKKGTYPQYKF